MTNTTFDNQGYTSINIWAEDFGSVLFQDCQFFVNTAIHITSEKPGRIFYPIRIANCFISETIEHPRDVSDLVIDTSEKILLRIWNVTIYTNNTYYTSDQEEFDRFLGHGVVMRESYFASGRDTCVKITIR